MGKGIFMDFSVFFAGKKRIFLKCKKKNVHRARWT